MTKQEARAEFQRRLRLVMNQRNVKPLTLARELGMSYDRVHRWLQGRCCPRADSLRLLCDRLRVSADYLLGVGE